MDIDEEDWLQLSGLQHYAFCKRQWALIYLENQWADNLRTIEGDFLHERAHDEQIREKRGDLLTIRGLRIHSRVLGISGQCDVVEFHRDGQGVALVGEQGLWLPVPVEYKRGSPKVNDADRLQLCAQAMCLEEMLLCARINEGYLYYGETTRRERVPLDADLRDTVATSLADMHRMAARRQTPKVKPNKGCNACSLKDVCLPFLQNKRSAAAYIASRIREDAPEGSPPCEN